MSEETRIRAALTWLCHFITMDMAMLRRGDWLNLADEMQQIFGEPVALELLTPAIVVACQEEAKRHIEACTQGSTVDTPLGSIRGRVGATYQMTEDGPRLRLLFRGDVLDHWRFRLVLLVWRHSHLLAVCPACGTIFCRVRKQVYCSRPCGNRVSVQRWRQRAEVRAAEADRAHARDAAQRQATLGEETPVSRRRCQRQEPPSCSS